MTPGLLRRCAPRNDDHDSVKCNLHPRQQRAGGGGDVLVAHQRFAHQEGFDARLGQPLAVGVTGNAAFRDYDPALRNRRPEPLAYFERGLEGAQVSVVDADEIGPQATRAVGPGVGRRR